MDKTAETATNNIKRTFAESMVVLILLVLLSVVFITIRLKVFWGEQPLKDQEDWNIIYFLRFFPKKKPTRLHIALPYQTGYYEVISENLSYSNMDIEIRTRPNTGQRELIGMPRNQECRVTFNTQFHLRVQGQT